MCWLSRIETKLNESVPIQTYVKLQLNEALLNLRDEHQKPHWHNKQREVILHYNYLRVISSEGMPPIVSQLCCTCHSPYLSLSSSHTHHCPQTSPWHWVCVEVIAGWQWDEVFYLRRRLGHELTHCLSTFCVPEALPVNFHIQLLPNLLFQIKNGF